MSGESTGRFSAAVKQVEAGRATEQLAWKVGVRRHGVREAQAVRQLRQQNAGLEPSVDKGAKT